MMIVEMQVTYTQRLSGLLMQHWTSMLRCASTGSVERGLQRKGHIPVRNEPKSLTDALGHIAWTTSVTRAIAAERMAASCDVGSRTRQKVTISEEPIATVSSAACCMHRTAQMPEQSYHARCVCFCSSKESAEFKRYPSAARDLSGVAFALPSRS